MKTHSYVVVTTLLAQMIVLLFTSTTCIAGLIYSLFIVVYVKMLNDYCLTAAIILVYILFRSSRFADMMRSCLSISSTVVI